MFKVLIIEKEQIIYESFNKIFNLSSTYEILSENNQSKCINYIKKNISNIIVIIDSNLLIVSDKNVLIEIRNIKEFDTVPISVIIGSKVGKNLKEKLSKFNIQNMIKEPFDKYEIETFLNRERIISEKYNSLIVEKNEKVNDIYEAIPDAVIITDLKGKIININNYAVDLIGYVTKDEIIGKNIFEFVVKKETTKLKDDMLEIIKNGYSYTIDYNFITKGKSVFNGEMDRKLVKDNFGENDFFFTIIKDMSQRKFTEDELSKEKELSKSYLDISEVMFLVIDIETRIKMINPKGLSVLEYNENEILGKNWNKKFFTEKSKKIFMNVFNKFFIGEIDLLNNLEYDVITKNGGVKTISWKLSVIKDSDNMITGILCSGEDITEKNLILNRLQLQDAALNKAINGMLISDNNWAITWINNAYTKLTGYNKRDIIGKNLSDIYPKNSEEIFNNIKNNKTWKGVIKRNKKSGSLYFEEQTITPIKNEENEISNYISIIKDTTLRKKALAKMKELHGIIDKSPIIIITWKNAKDWPIELISENIRSFGYEANDFFSGKLRFSEIIHKDDVNRVDSEIKNHIINGDLEFDLKYRILTINNEERIVKNTLWANLNNNKIETFQGIIIDIT